MFLKLIYVPQGFKSTPEKFIHKLRHPIGGRGGVGQKMTFYDTLKMYDIIYEQPLISPLYFDFP